MNKEEEKIASRPSGYPQDLPKINKMSEETPRIPESFYEKSGYDNYAKQEGSIRQKEVTKDLEWKNIEHEEYRVYVFPDGSSVQITNPVKLNVSKSGGHRVLDVYNMAHYIPSGWIHLYWETFDNIAFRF